MNIYEQVHQPTVYVHQGLPPSGCLPSKKWPSILVHWHHCRVSAQFSPGLLSRGLTSPVCHHCAQQILMLSCMVQDCGGPMGRCQEHAECHFFILREEILKETNPQTLRIRYFDIVS